MNVKTITLNIVDQGTKVNSEADRDMQGGRDLLLVNKGATSLYVGGVKADLDADAVRNGYELVAGAEIAFSFKISEAVYVRSLADNGSLQVVQTGI
jgi:hypothetical protein